MRGASTITQQLVKNLFFTTHRNPATQGVRVYAGSDGGFDSGQTADLELYLNVVEWGPAGMYRIQEGAQVPLPCAGITLDRDASRTT